MRFTSETTSDGVSERLFTLGDIAGVLWSPPGAAGRRPLVLLGHGGGQHKKAPGRYPHPLARPGGGHAARPFGINALSQGADLEPCCRGAGRRT